MRTATLTGSDRVRLETVRRFLPSNYSATSTIRVSGYKVEETIVITGEDVAGWTMDGYVLPRLASGGMYAKEVC